MTIISLTEAAEEHIKKMIAKRDKVWDLYCQSKKQAVQV